MMGVSRRIVSALSFPLIVAGVWAQAPSPTEASEVFDVSLGEHPLGAYFGYEIKDTRLMIYHSTEERDSKHRELLGTAPINFTFFEQPPRDSFAISDDGRTLLYVHMSDSPLIHPSPPKILKNKPSGLYEYTHGRGDRLIYGDVNLITGAAPLARNAIRFTRASRMGTYQRTTEGQESLEDEIGWTPLHRAAFLGDVTAIQRLLEEGATIDARAGQGFTPLNTAISNGQEAAAKILIEAGADVSARPRAGLSPIHQAAWLGHTGIVAAFAKGSGLNSKDEHGKSPLESALRTGRYETATFLVNQGADLAGRDSSGDTPLHVLARVNPSDPVWLSGKKPDVEDAAGTPRGTLLRLMIDKGADVNARNNAGETPLQIAQRYKRAAMSQLLLERGAETDGHGKSRR